MSSGDEASSAASNGAPENENSSASPRHQGTEQEVGGVSRTTSNNGTNHKSSSAAAPIIPPIPAGQLLVQLAASGVGTSTTAHQLNPALFPPQQQLNRIQGTSAHPSSTQPQGSPATAAAAPLDPLAQYTALAAVQQLYGAYQQQPPSGAPQVSVAPPPSSVPAQTTTQQASTPSSSHPGPSNLLSPALLASGSHQNAAQPTTATAASTGVLIGGNTAPFALNSQQQSPPIAAATLGQNPMAPPAFPLAAFQQLQAWQALIQQQQQHAPPHVASASPLAQAAAVNAMLASAQAQQQQLSMPPTNALGLMLAQQQQNVTASQQRSASQTPVQGLSTPSPLPASTTTSSILQNPLNLVLSQQPQQLPLVPPQQQLGLLAAPTATSSSALSTATTPPTGRPPFVLYQEGDEDTLTDYQCLLRKQIEVFEATVEDINSNAQGRNTPILVGQVGLRCRYCANIPRTSRTKGSTYYSQSIEGIYQVAQNMAKVHFCSRCQTIPADVQRKLQALRQENQRASGGKVFWSRSAMAQGVYEVGRVLRLRPLTQVPNTTGLLSSGAASGGGGPSV